MSWNVSRTPPASGNMTTADHGPVPLGVCRVTGHAPSGVVTVAETLGMVPFYSSASQVS